MNFVRIICSMGNARSPVPMSPRLTLFNSLNVCFIVGSFSTSVSTSSSLPATRKVDICSTVDNDESGSVLLTSPSYPAPAPVHQSDQEFPSCECTLMPVEPATFFIQSLRWVLGMRLLYVYVIWLISNVWFNVSACPSMCWLSVVFDDYKLDCEDKVLTLTRLRAGPSVFFPKNAENGGIFRTRH